MSVRAGPNGEAIPLVGDGPDALVNTPTPEPYETKKFTGGTVIYDSCHGVKRHVPLCESSKTDIHRAVEDSDPARLVKLLETPLKASIDAKDFMGFTALHYSVMMSTTGPKRGQADPPRIDCCKMLIEAGADLNVQGQWEQTALHIAANSLYPAVEVIEALVNAKADLLVTDQWGNTAIHIAALGSRSEQLKQLLKHPDAPAAEKIKNKEGLTALNYAENIYTKQEKKVELAPVHCEVKLLLEGKGGLPGPDWSIKPKGKVVDPGGSTPSA